MLNKPLLTISIPTYCRSEYLAKCLDALLLSSGSLPESDLAKIEVCIFDNSENDDSSLLICKRSIYKKLNLVYKKNSENIGSDRNILQSLLAPKSKYVAIMSDDDFVEKDYFLHVLKIINNDDPDLIFLKAYGLTGKDDMFSSTLMSSYKYKIYTSPISLLFDRLIQVGFVSTTIFKRDKIDDSIAMESVGTNLVQVGACFSIMENMTSATYSAKNLVKVTRNNSGGYSPIIVFYSKLFNLMQNFNNFGMSNKELFKFKNKLLLVFYSRSFAQYFRSSGRGLAGDERKILDDAFIDNNIYRLLIQKLFIVNNAFSFSFLSLIFVMANLAYYPGRFFDFLIHALNYFHRKLIQ